MKNWLEVRRLRKELAEALARCESLEFQRVNLSEMLERREQANEKLRSLLRAKSPEGPAPTHQLMHKSVDCFCGKLH